MIDRVFSAKCSGPARAGLTHHPSALRPGPEGRTDARTSPRSRPSSRGPVGHRRRRALRAAQRHRQAVAGAGGGPRPRPGQDRQGRGRGGRPVPHRQSSAPATPAGSSPWTPTACCTCRCPPPTSAPTTRRPEDHLRPARPRARTSSPPPASSIPSPTAPLSSPASRPPAYQGGTTLHGTGINPGFMCDFLPLALTGLSDRVDHIYVRESSDLRGHPSRQVVVDLIGFTRPAGDYATMVRPFRAFQRIALRRERAAGRRRAGRTAGRGGETDEFEVAARAFEIAAGPVREGTVCASRWVFSGLVRGRPFMTVEVRLQGRLRPDHPLARARLRAAHRGRAAAVGAGRRTSATGSPPRRRTRSTPSPPSAPPRPASAPCWTSPSRPAAA